MILIIIVIVILMLIFQIWFFIEFSSNLRGVKQPDATPKKSIWHNATEGGHQLNLDDVRNAVGCTCGESRKVDLICPIHTKHSDAKLDAMIETVKTGIAVKPKDTPETKRELPERFDYTQCVGLGRSHLALRLTRVMLAINQLIDYLRYKEEGR